MLLRFTNNAAGCFDHILFGVPLNLATLFHNILIVSAKYTKAITQVITKVITKESNLLILINLLF